MSTEAKYCDGCGCSMLYTTIKGDKINIIALHLSLGTDGHLARQVLGPYGHKEYNFCFQCYLKALGVEP